MKYRLLKKWEQIQDGDEVSGIDNKWSKTIMVGEKAGWCSAVKYRRPIKKKKGIK